MKKIPKTMSRQKKGWANKIESKLVKRNEHVALYELNENRGYEVMLIKIRTANSMIGKRIVGKKGDEYLPGDSQWGFEGWSYPAGRKDLAELRFEEQTLLRTGKGLTPDTIEKWYEEHNWPNSMKKSTEAFIRKNR